MKNEQIYKEQIRNLIILLFDNSLEDWKAIDNEDFIKYVCNEINLSQDEYSNIMGLNFNGLSPERHKVIQFMENNPVLQNLHGEKWYCVEDAITKLIEDIKGE